MEPFLLIFLINFAFCCNTHKKCGDCVIDLANCFWIQAYMGEFYCFENEDEGAFVVTNCMEETAAAQSFNGTENPIFSS